MAIIVEETKSRRQYFLLGASLGIYKLSTPSLFGGNLFPDEEEGSVESVAVCDSEGTISFLNGAELRVAEIDGRKIEDIGKLLNAGNSGWNETDNRYNTCPACGEPVGDEEQECKACGLAIK